MTDAPGIDLTTGIVRPRTWRIVKPIARGLLKVLFGLTIEGAERIPADKPFILVSNHLHNGDPIFTIVSTPGHVRYMAKDDLFEIPGIKQLISWVGAFPVHREKVDRTAIRHAQEVLKQGYQLAIFPEGGRSKSMKIESVKSGAGMFAMRGNVLVVPCGIIGSERLPFNGNKQHNARELAGRTYAHRGVFLRYGEPFTVPPEIDGKRTTADMATDYMMRRVAELLPEEYRGIYGTSEAPAE